VAEGTIPPDGSGATKPSPPELFSVFDVFEVFEVPGDLEVLAPLAAADLFAAVASFAAADSRRPEDL
jgi:hypothetical protein